MDPETFNQLWRERQEFQFSPPDEKEERCVYAQHFGAWAEALYQEEVRAPSHVGINQKMLLLTKKYFEWRPTVPKSHRDRISDRGHVCIFAIFERTFYRLRVLELALVPPMLFIPPPPPAPPALPPPPQIAAITFGELVGEEEE